MKHIPRKRFGQNFLKDSAVLYAIIDAIAPRETDCMLEIGPGLGAMTEKLLPHLERLTSGRCTGFRCQYDLYATRPQNPDRRESAL